MSHPNSKQFLARTSTKENNGKTISLAGEAGKTILGGAKKSISPSTKRKSL